MEQLKVEQLKVEQLKNDLRGIVAAIGGLPRDFDSSADLYSELHVESFQTIDILAALEERYNVSIPDDEYMNARSLDGLSQMMDSLLGKQAQ